MPYYAITLEDLLVIRNCSDRIYSCGIALTGRGFGNSEANLFKIADGLNQVIYRTLNQGGQNPQLEFDF